MKDVAKILSLVLILLLLLPVAKIDYEIEFWGQKAELKEYMNYFSVGLGLDQTMKFEMEGETEKSKPKMSGSIIALIALILIIAGAAFLNIFNTGDTKSTYIIMGIYAATFIFLLLLPMAVKNIKIDGESLKDGIGSEYVKMTIFYFISLLSTLGIVGIFAKEKFLGE